MLATEQNTDALSAIQTPYAAEQGAPDIYRKSWGYVRIYRGDRLIGEANRTGIAGIDTFRAVYRLHPCWGGWLPSANYFVLEGGRFYEVTAWRAINER